MLASPAVLFPLHVPANVDTATHAINPVTETLIQVHPATMLTIANYRLLFVLLNMKPSGWRRDHAVRLGLCLPLVFKELLSAF